MTYNSSLLQLYVLNKKLVKNQKIYVYLNTHVLVANEFHEHKLVILIQAFIPCALFKKSWKIKMLRRGNQKTFNCSKLWMDKTCQYV
jgi:hypothetical protein